MRTLILILIGMVFASSLLGFAGPQRKKIFLWAFCALWLAAVVLNLMTGLSHGYSLQEELPIQLLIYAAPVGLAAWLARKRR